MAVNFLQHFCKDLMISMILHQTNQMYVITSEYQCVSLYRARNQTRPSPWRSMRHWRETSCVIHRTHMHFILQCSKCDIATRSNCLPSESRVCTAAEWWEELHNRCGCPLLQPPLPAASNKRVYSVRHHLLTGFSLFFWSYNGSPVITFLLVYVSSSVVKILNT